MYLTVVNRVHHRLLLVPMGRTAKYFTLHDRQVAESKQKALHACTK